MRTFAIVASVGTVTALAIEEQYAAHVALHPTYPSTLEAYKANDLLIKEHALSPEDPIHKLAQVLDAD